MLTSKLSSVSSESHFAGPPELKTDGLNSNIYRQRQFIGITGCLSWWRVLWIPNSELSWWSADVDHVWTQSFKKTLLALCCHAFNNSSELESAIDLLLKQHQPALPNNLCQLGYTNRIKVNYFAVSVIVIALYQLRSILFLYSKTRKGHNLRMIKHIENTHRIWSTPNWHGLPAVLRCWAYMKITLSSCSVIRALKAWILRKEGCWVSMQKEHTDSYRFSFIQGVCFHPSLLAMVCRNLLTGLPNSDSLSEPQDKGSAFTVNY